MRIGKNIVPFIDVLFTFLMVFVSITMLLKAKTDTDNAAYQQQNVIYLIALNWEGDADLDLWAKDPQNRLVSFNRREGGEGSLFSLNRDCLGAQVTEMNDKGVVVSKINEEIISIRGTFMGEYVVNVHAFNLRETKKPIKASVKFIKNKPYKIIIEKSKELSFTGEEQTFFRFSIDKNGEVTEMNDLPISLIKGS